MKLIGLENFDFVYGILYIFFIWNCRWLSPWVNFSNAQTENFFICESLGRLFIKFSFLLYEMNFMRTVLPIMRTSESFRYHEDFIVFNLLPDRKENCWTRDWVFYVYALYSHPFCTVIHFYVRLHNGYTMVTRLWNILIGDKVIH